MLNKVQGTTCVHAFSGWGAGGRRRGWWKSGGVEVCSLSDAAVSARGEMKAEERVQLVYRQELWPISRSWILNRLADVKQPGALQATSGAQQEGRGEGARVCARPAQQLQHGIILKVSLWNALRRMELCACDWHHSCQHLTKSFFIHLWCCGVSLCPCLQCVTKDFTLYPDWKPHNSQTDFLINGIFCHFYCVS